MLSANLILMNNGREPYNHDRSIRRSLGSAVIIGHKTFVADSRKKLDGKHIGAVYHSRAPLAYMP